MTEFITSLEELDTALVERFMGIMIDGKEVPVYYYTPDIDLVKVEAPAIVIYRTNPFLDTSRITNDEYFFDTTETGVTKREHPEPWSALYSVKTLYEYQLDGIALNDKILRLFRRGGYLTVKNVDYHVEMTSAGLWGSQYKDFGRVEDGQRKFQETYSYRIDFMLEVSEDGVEVSLVDEVVAGGELTN